MSLQRSENIEQFCFLTSSCTCYMSFSLFSW